MELKGTKTEKNLLTAFAGESQARNKYTYFASTARKEGYEQIAAIFEETANNEKEHAKMWLKALFGGDVKDSLKVDTKEALKLAAEGENYEWTEMYAEMAKDAKEEGFDKLAYLFEEVGKIAKEHDVSQLFIAITSASAEQKRKILELCTSTSINTKVMNFSLQNDNVQQISVEDIQIEDLLNRPSIDLKIEEIASYLIDKTVCVTGAGGSIGSELCRQIVRFKPKELVMIDINENSLYMLEQEFMREKRLNHMSQDIKIISLIVSIREKDELMKVMHQYKPDVVYHAAAHKHVPLMETRPSEAILNNIVGTKNVIEACIDCDVSRFIMISTDKAVNPTNVMGATKRMTELIMQSRKTDKPIKMAAVRFGNVLGSNGSVIPIFKEQIKKGGPVTVTDKNVQRYFMTIPEATQLVLQAGYYANHREIFVLDMGEPVKIINLAEKMIRLAGYVPYDEIEIQEIGLRPGEKMFEELALEIEKCHKTDNNLIFVHESINYDQDEIDGKVDMLRKAAKEIDDPAKLKSLLMDAIKD